MEFTAEKWVLTNRNRGIILVDESGDAQVNIANEISNTRVGA